MKINYIKFTDTVRNAHKEEWEHSTVGIGFTVAKIEIDTFSDNPREAFAIDVVQASYPNDSDNSHYTSPGRYPEENGKKLLKSFLEAQNVNATEEPGMFVIETADFYDLYKQLANNTNLTDKEIDTLVKSGNDHHMSEADKLVTESAGKFHKKQKSDRAKQQQQKNITSEQEKIPEGNNKLGDKTPYEVLEINTNASPQEVKAAYRKLVFKYGPDKNPGNEEAAKKFKQIEQAYRLLNNPVYLFFADNCKNLETAVTISENWNKVSANESQKQHLSNFTKFYTKSSPEEKQKITEKFQKTYNFFADILPESLQQEEILSLMVLGVISDNTPNAQATLEQTISEYEQLSETEKQEAKQILGEVFSKIFSSMGIDPNYHSNAHAANPQPKPAPATQNKIDIDSPESRKHINILKAYTWFQPMPDEAAVSTHVGANNLRVPIDGLVPQDIKNIKNSLTELGLPYEERRSSLLGNTITVELQQVDKFKQIPGISVVSDEVYKNAKAARQKADLAEEENSTPHHNNELSMDYSETFKPQPDETPATPKGEKKMTEDKSTFSQEEKEKLVNIFNGLKVNTDNCRVEQSKTSDTYIITGDVKLEVPVSGENEQELLDKVKAEFERNVDFDYDKGNLTITASETPTKLAPVGQLSKLFNFITELNNAALDNQINDKRNEVGAALNTLQAEKQNRNSAQNEQPEKEAENKSKTPAELGNSDATNSTTPEIFCNVGERIKHDLYEIKIAFVNLRIDDSKANKLSSNLSKLGNNESGLPLASCTILGTDNAVAENFPGLHDKDNGTGEVLSIKFDKSVDPAKIVQAAKDCNLVNLEPSLNKITQHFNEAFGKSAEEEVESKEAKSSVPKPKIADPIPELQDLGSFFEIEHTRKVDGTDPLNPESYSWETTLYLRFDDDERSPEHIRNNFNTYKAALKENFGKCEEDLKSHGAELYFDENGIDPTRRVSRALASIKFDSNNENMENIIQTLIINGFPAESLNKHIDGHKRHLDKQQKLITAERALKHMKVKSFENGWPHIEVDGSQDPEAVEALKTLIKSYKEDGYNLNDNAWLGVVEAQEPEKSGVYYIVPIQPVGKNNKPLGNDADSMSDKAELYAAHENFSAKDLGNTVYLHRLLSTCRSTFTKSATESAQQIERLENELVKYKEQANNRPKTSSPHSAEAGTGTGVTVTGNPDGSCTLSFSSPNVRTEFLDLFGAYLKAESLEELRKKTGSILLNQKATELCKTKIATVGQDATLEEFAQKLSDEVARSLTSSTKEDPEIFVKLSKHKDAPEGGYNGMWVGIDVKRLNPSERKTLSSNLKQYYNDNIEVKEDSNSILVSFTHDKYTNPASTAGMYIDEICQHFLPNQSVYKDKYNKNGLEEAARQANAALNRQDEVYQESKGSLPSHTPSNSTTTTRTSSMPGISARSSESQYTGAALTKSQQANAHWQAAKSQALTFGLTALGGTMTLAAFASGAWILGVAFAAISLFTGNKAMDNSAKEYSKATASMRQSNLLRGLDVNRSESWPESVQLTDEKLEEIYKKGSPEENMKAYKNELKESQNALQELDVAAAENAASRKKVLGRVMLGAGGIMLALAVVMNPAIGVSLAAMFSGSIAASAPSAAVAGSNITGISTVVGAIATLLGVSTLSRGKDTTDAAKGYVGQVGEKKGSFLDSIRETVATRER